MLVVNLSTITLYIYADGSATYVIRIKNFINSCVFEGFMAD